MSLEFESDYPKPEWLPHLKDEKMFRVAIIGGGQSGLAISFALMREKVPQVIVLDRNPKFKAGPWNNFARMPTLRTPKHVTGPEYGISSLGVRFWFENKYGKKAWEELELLKTSDWAEYLNWFESTNKLNVRHDTEVGAFKWNELKKAYEIPCRTLGKVETIYAEKVVLATGIDGSGEWHIPSFIKESIPREFYFHTSESIDFKSFSGKNIGILGAGASAFDNAILALKAGANSVSVYFRRKKLVTINPYRWMESVGFLRHHKDLSDELKWKFIEKIFEIGQLPPKDTFEAAMKFENFHLHPGCSWDKLEVFKNQVKIHTTIRSTKGVVLKDKLIIATGIKTDLSLRPELKFMAPDIKIWKDAFTPHKNREFTNDMLRSPYLGHGFELMSKNKNTHMHGIFNYTFGAFLSQGLSGASISGMKYSVQTLVEAITKQFYLENIDKVYKSLEEFAQEEFQINL